jgi:protocatechuate 3,4-dioxygenase beta subunit
VEIWQCDAHRHYHHVDMHDERNAALDPNFQGWGRSVCDADGRYGFRTIRPLPYSGRTAHIHFKVTGPDFEPFTTQMFDLDQPDNRNDPILNAIDDARERATLLVKFAPDAKEPALLRATFDIVLAADGRSEAATAP